MKLILDGEKIANQEELHKQMEQTLDFPEWYGGNLDALYDCLTELMQEVDICIQNPDALRQNLGDYAGKVLTVLQDAANANINISVTILESSI